MVSHTLGLRVAINIIYNNQYYAVIRNNRYSKEYKNKAGIMRTFYLVNTCLCVKENTIHMCGLEFVVGILFNVALDCTHVVATNSQGSHHGYLYFPNDCHSLVVMILLRLI